MPSAKKVSRGDPFEFSADLYNRLIDLVPWMEQLKRGGLGTPAKIITNDPIELPVRNDSGADQEQFAVLGISGSLFNYSTGDNPPSVHSIAIKGVTPAASHTSRYCVLQEPLKSGAIGKAVIRGLTPVKVDTTTGIANDWADIVVGNATKLKVASIGSARIIGTPVTGQLCYVILGNTEPRPRFLKLTDNWASSNAFSSSTTAPFYLRGNPCTDHLGSNPDTSTTVVLHLYCHHSGAKWKTPNAVANDIVTYGEDCNGVKICTADIWDDPVGTVKWWQFAPRGWALANGTANSVGNKGSGVDHRDKFWLYQNTFNTGGGDYIQIADHGAFDGGLVTNPKLHDANTTDGEGATRWMPSTNSEGGSHSHTIPNIAHGGAGTGAAVITRVDANSDTVNDSTRYSIIPPNRDRFIIERLNNEHGA